MIRDGNNVEKELAVSGGLIEVSQNTATILADTVEFVDEIDLGRAQDELKRAEELLNISVSNEDRERARHSKEKATNRIGLYHKHN